MRSRKAAAAIVVEDLPLDEEPVDAIPPDDTAADEAFSAAGGAPSLERICVDCGSSGGAHDGCAHRERARFHAPTRAALELVARLRRAAAEHRAATRALRALVTAEHARGRAEIEREEPEPLPPPEPAAAPEPPPPAAPEPDDAPPALCPRCAEPIEAAPAEPEAPQRRPKRKGRVPLEQQAFPFTGDSEQRSPHGA
ncbi:hypothetical protein [Sorangium cellulosum]|uniref:hypothetical protein n=1 Tax=Sorangium cellulosum TaxID=56 RepID=UPI000422D381|nr:hypothetical protein [Sorangium cellulosum]